MFVIAQGTVFALHERQMDAGQAGRTLDVDYVVGGALRRRDRHLLVSVELAESRSARVLWAETFSRSVDDAFAVLEEIGNRIVVSVASEIETVERNRAILKPPESLDAWEAYHRGLWHMYRFERTHNARARTLFERAIRLDPTFSRAYAGLSFTHFQEAFQGWDARAPQTVLALQAARQSLLADDRDPAAHWAMGRAQWLLGNPRPAVSELAHAVDLSPNYALAHYNLAFVNGTAGDAQAAIASADTSRDLSPFDPMLFGMFGARAMALVRLERFEEAADWAVKAAARPNAFAHIQAIAAYTLALAARDDEARSHWTDVQQAAPGYRLDSFLDAFRFDAHGTALYREAARRLGSG
jgi:tetratricopeptide (TPR) repeat protein